MQNKQGNILIKLTLSLSGFALVITVLLTIIYGITVDKIAEQKQKYLQKQLYQVCNLEFGKDSITIEPIASLQATAINYTLIKSIQKLTVTDSKKVFYVINFIATNGYSGDIELIMALNSFGEISGVSVVSHKETPGLGDKIELKKSDWITKFNGLSLTSYTSKDWTVTKDGGKFDAFSGATITPRAVVASIYDSIKLFEQYFIYE